MSDDEDGDTFVTIGTPFQPLEEDEGGEERKLVYAKQRKPGETYRERRERQRFHGAFTGGFSAGYFNTVGSEAGWTPSSFSSSRRNKAELMAQQPEHYMDDEDLGRYGIAPRRITATREFHVDPQGAVDELGRMLGKRQLGGKERDASVLADLFGDSFLKDIVRPARTSMGSVLLQSMGWKEGQGVGSKRARKMEKGTKSYSCLLHPSVAATKGGHLSEEGAAVLVAPRDVRPWLAEPKDDRHGIGYSGIQEDRVGEMRGKTRSTGVHGLSGQAFGVGALEEDDDDIYGSERLTDYHSSALAEEEAEEKFGWTGPHATEAWSLSSAFKLLKRMLQLQKAYPPPVLPKGFKPVYKTTTPEKGPVTQRPPSQPMDATVRAQLTSGKASVFTLLKSEDRERLQHGSTAGERAQEKRANRWDQAPPPTARMAEESGAHGQNSGQREPHGSGQREPHGSGQREPHGSGQRERHGSGQREPHGVTEWQREESSRRVFPTLGGNSFASKFTSAGHIGDVQERASKVDDRVQPASVDKVGQLSREVIQWYPHRVLCKRFDIPDPYPSSGVVGVPKVEKNSSQTNSRTKSLAFSAPSIASSHTARQGGSHGDGAQEGLAAGGGLWRRDGGSQEEQKSSSVKQSAADGEPSVSKKDKEEEAMIPPEAEPEKRPSLDIFKAIFAESSASESESDSGEDHEDARTAGVKVAQGPLTVAQGPLAVAPVKDIRLTSSNTVVLQTRGSGSSGGEEEGMDVCTREHPEVTQASTATVSFGPALPPSFSAGHSDSSSDDDIGDGRQIKPKPSREKHKKKRHKKDKSHRRHRHKDKHKHKDEKAS